MQAYGVAKYQILVLKFFLPDRSFAAWVNAPSVKLKALHIRASIVFSNVVTRN